MANKIIDNKELHKVSPTCIIKSTVDWHQCSNVHHHPLCGIAWIRTTIIIFTRRKFEPWKNFSFHPHENAEIPTVIKNSSTGNLYPSMYASQTMSTFESLWHEELKKDTLSPTLAPKQSLQYPSDEKKIIKEPLFSNL